VNWSGCALPVFSAALSLRTTICFVAVWDQVTAVTTFPQWSWALLGILSATLAWRLLKPHARLPLLLLGLWLCTTLYFSDNFVSVLRAVGHGFAPSSHAQIDKRPAPHTTRAIVWLKRLSALSCYAVRTVHSDHRMVVTDLVPGTPIRSSSSIEP